MEEASKEEIPELVTRELISNYIEGRDELNLAEFPISAIGKRWDQSVKTILFQDTVYDQSIGQTIPRTLRIDGSATYGLPTAPDDEILLGILQLSRIQSFKSPTVTFTLYQLLKILGWKPSSNNYRRLRESVHRWLGVTLYCNNAWRDKRTGNWINKSEGFHILDNAKLYESANRENPDGCSSIKWNEIVFRNLQEGNIKVLDFHLYRSLKSSIAKRLYRFLDKRFYRKSSITYPLEAFACEKIGLTRPIKMNASGHPTSDIAQLKRLLLNPIRELEVIGYIKPMAAPSQRFAKGVQGVWEVYFERQQSLSPEQAEQLEQVDLPLISEDVSPLEGRLISHGVTRLQAKKLVSDYHQAQIEIQLEVLEFLLAKGGEAAPANRGGWLVKAVTENYSQPRGFKSTAQRLEESRLKAEKAGPVNV